MIKKEMLKIEKKIEGKKVVQGFRHYIGASSIGSECHNAAWLGFRCVMKREITPQQQRLFSRGHNEEPIIIRDLKSIGIKVKSAQKGESFADGHGGGHCDGILVNVPGFKEIEVLGEFKTANQNNFDKVKRVGVKKWKPVYYRQAQVYMKIYKLPVALFIVVNKNTDERHYEFVNFDQIEADAMLCKAVNIASSKIQVAKVSLDPKFYLCDWCDYSPVCYKEIRPLKHCRTCTFAEVLPKGKWRCGKTGKYRKWHKKLKKNEQLTGCKKHKYIIGLT